MGHRAQKRARTPQEAKGSHPRPHRRLYSGAAMNERYKVARRADISAGQIYRWRQELRGAAGFAQVLIAPAESAAANGVAPCPEPAIEVEVGKARVRIPLNPGGIGGGGHQGAVAAMIPVPSGVRVWLAVGQTDMRRGMNSLAVQVQQVLSRSAQHSWPICLTGLTGGTRCAPGGRRSRAEAATV